MRVSDLHPPRRPSREFEFREVVFTVAQARRALPYVARLLRDAYQAYRCVQDARQKLLDTRSRREAEELIRQRDYAIDRLNEIIDECNAVGLAHIHIPSGLAAFHAVVGGWEATLVWRIDQPLESAWRELDSIEPAANEVPDDSASQACRSDSVLATA